MKTHTKLPSPPPIDPDELPIPHNGHSLKAYFIGCASQGRIACEEAQLFDISKEDLIDWAYDVGERMFEKYTEENLSMVKKFNRKVGV